MNDKDKIFKLFMEVLQGLHLISTRYLVQTSDNTREDLDDLKYEIAWYEARMKDLIYGDEP